MKRGMLALVIILVLFMIGVIVQFSGLGDRIGLAPSDSNDVSLEQCIDACFNDHPPQTDPDGFVFCVRECQKDPGFCDTSASCNIGNICHGKSQPDSCGYGGFCLKKPGITNCCSCFELGGGPTDPGVDEPPVDPFPLPPPLEPRDE